jgi:tetratricopeptide (TPR) repeat protein
LKSRYISTTRKYRIAGPVLLIFFFLSGCVILTPRYIAGSRFERARILYEEGRIVEAVALIGAIDKASPDYRKAQRLKAEMKAVSRKVAARHAALGREYEEAGIIPAAISQYRTSLKLDPLRTTVGRRLALLEAARRRTGLLSGYWRALPSDTLETVEAGYVKGKEHLEAGDFKEAIVEFKAVLRVLPSDTDTRGLLASAEKGLSELVDRHFKKGISYFEKEEMILAIKEWDIVLELDSGNVKADEYRLRAELILERLEKIKRRQTEPSL